MTPRLGTLAETTEHGAGQRLCDCGGCLAQGVHRAPKSRSALRDYYWFCLDHIRSYNSSWNYYSGMSEQEVEGERRGDTVWHRPTWPFSGGQPHGRICDPFGLFDENPNGPSEPAPAPATPVAEAMAILDLTPPLSIAGLKKRYKELVKRHHPDANGGDKTAEEKLKSINHAHDLLRQVVVF